MRVKEEFKKSGYFWLPSTPNHKVSGMLSISDGGDIVLEIVGLLEKLFNDNFDLGRVVGYIEGCKPVTLESCRYLKNKNYSKGIIAELSVDVHKIYANRALIGKSYEENEIISFKKFQFSVEGIDEWVGINGINVDNQFGEGQTSTITFTLPTEIELNLDNGMKLVITFFFLYPLGFQNPKEAKISQKTFFKLTSETEHSLDSFIAIARKISTFLCFAIDKTVSMDYSVSFFNDTTAIEIYSSIGLCSKNEPQISQNKMLFQYDDVKDNAETVINNWLKLYDEVEPAMNLYFSTKTGGQKYIEGQFVALVQGLEAYHWRISTDKTSLEKKIERLIKPFEDIVGDEDRRKEIAEGIKHTRNYLTHHEPAREKKAAKGLDMCSLNLKMEAIFQLNFLEMLGFTSDEIQSIFYKNYELRYKLGITR